MPNITLARAAALVLWFACNLASAQAFKDYAGTWQFTISGGDDGKGTAVVDLTRSMTKLVLQSCTLGCLSRVSIMKRE